MKWKVIKWYFLQLKESIAHLKNETILRKLEFNEENEMYECKGFYLTDHPIAGQLTEIYKIEEKKNNVSIFNTWGNIKTNRTRS